MSSKFKDYKRTDIKDDVLNAGSTTHYINLENLYDGSFSHYGKVEAVQLDYGEEFRRFMIIDPDFVNERLRVANKHLRDYDNLPDKGQFPFIHQKGTKAVYTGTVSFFGSVDEKEKLVVEEI